MLFRSIGVNGASSGSILKDQQFILSRDNLINSSPQKPLLLFMAMIGNDVCSSKVTGRTTPDEYHDNMLQSILELDPRLPKGTKVVLIPLVDGRILFDTMHDLIHPIGQLHQDVTYKDFYDYLNCLQISPCAGWMKIGRAHV